MIFHRANVCTEINPYGVELNITANSDRFLVSFKTLAQLVLPILRKQWVQLLLPS